MDINIESHECDSESGCKEDEENEESNRDISKEKMIRNCVKPDRDKHEIKYYKYQQTHLRKCFGKEARKTSDIRSFKNAIKKFYSKISSGDKGLFPHIQKFADEVHLSRDQGGKLLKLLVTVRKQLFKGAHIPRTWQTIVTYSKEIDEHEEEFVLKKVVDYPKSWNMNTWAGPKLKKIELLVRDPIAAIATMLVDPLVAYGWKDHIHLNTFKKYLEDQPNGRKGERLYGDIFSAEYAERTENEMRTRTKEPFAVFMPILGNSDGVAVGSTNQQVCTVMGSIGNFSGEFLRSPDSKFCLGYIPKLPIAKNILVKHLMDKAKMNKTRAKIEVEVFLRLLDNEVWKLFMAPIIVANKDGIYLRLLNMQYKHAILVYPYFMHHIGDEPGQKRVCGMFEGNANYFCIQCDFRFNHDVRPKFRSKRVNEIKQLCKISEGYLFKERKNVTEAELQSVTQLRQIGLHPGLHPLMTAPRGDKNDIFRTPYDLLHTWPGGIMKTLAFQCCVIINASVGNITLFDNRLSTFPRLPDCLPHVTITTFPKGEHGARNSH
jgi:hypothetical protein